MTLVDKWANVEKVKIHYLASSDYDKNLIPLVYVPGALNYAEQSIELMNHFKGRRCITMSLRGRGNSDAPSNSYSLNDHVQDINAVVLQSKVKNYCLMAYSMGVPYAIKFASTNPNLKGLIICDYPAKYPLIPETWTEGIISNGLIDKEKKYVVEGIQKESRQIDLQNELSLINVPVLIIKGGVKGSLLKDVEVEKYKDNLSNVTITNIFDSGHNLFEPDISVFLKIVQQFLRKLDTSS